MYFDLRLPLPGRVAGAILFTLLLTGSLWRANNKNKRLVIWAASVLAVLAWWFSLAPSTKLNWQPDVSRLPLAEVSGNLVIVHNIRNCRYFTETHYQPEWETKIFDLSQLRGVDLFLTYWGSQWIAHAIVSFHFADDTYLAMSIEARKTVNQEYSAVKGFFRQYQLIYLAAEEQDVVRVRTNYRQGENVYLYHTLLKPEDARNLFLQYASWMNKVQKQPQWYNALTSNCTSNVTSYLARAKVGSLSAWDWRTVLNGKGDEMLYQLGDLATDGLPFLQLKQQALINRQAQAGEGDSDFSRRIRAGRAGFAQ